MANGVDGALTGTPNFLVTHMLFANDLSLMSNDPNHMHTVLNRPGACAQRESLTVNAQKSVVMCLNSQTNDMSPPFNDGTQLPPCTLLPKLSQISGHVV